MAFAAVPDAIGRRRAGEAFGMAADAPDLAPSAGSPENAPLSPLTDACPELDCVRPLLPADVLAVTAQRARRIGVGADRVLIAGGLIDEETYLRALCGRLGMAFEPLDGVEHPRCALTGARLIDGAATGLLPLAEKDGLVLVVAPRGTAARRLIAMIEANPGLATRFRLGKRLTLQLLDLERMLSELQDGGVIPMIGEPPRSGGKGPAACAIGTRTPSDGGKGGIESPRKPTLTEWPRDSTPTHAVR